MKTLFLVLSGFASFMIIIIGVVFCTAHFNKNFHPDYNIITWMLTIHAVLWLVSIFTVSVYFNKNIWKKQNEIDMIKFELHKENLKLKAWIQAIGEHEAIKLIKRKS